MGTDNFCIRNATFTKFIYVTSLCLERENLRENNIFNLGRCNSSEGRNFHTRYFENDKPRAIPGKEKYTYGKMYQFTRIVMTSFN